MSGSAPVRVVNFDNLSQIISPPPPKYRYTWDRYRVDFEPGTPKKIVKADKGDDSFEILLRGFTPESVVNLFLGEGGEEELLENPHSAWVIIGTSGWVEEIADIEIWGISPHASTILVDIRSKKPNPFKRDMPPPLIIDKIIATGSNFKLPRNFYSSQGKNYLTNKLDSQLNIDGFKGFAFSSFAAGSLYEFNINLSEVADIIEFDKGEYLQVHMLSSFLMDELNGWFKCGWIDELLGYLPDSPLEEQKTWVAGVRRNNNVPIFKNKYSEDTNRIILRPVYSDKYYGFKIQTQDGWKVAVFDYNKATQSFAIKGF